MSLCIKRFFWICLILSGAYLNISISPAMAEGECLCDKLDNPTDVANFFDQQLAEGLKKYNTAGAAVVVVKDGKIIFSKGFGRADVDNDSPVSPDKTLFRMASVSKLFTVTALMQLVEQGKVNLDDNVNLYLKDFQIPNTFEKPITLRHLVTHTAGFEDKWAGVLFLSEPSRLVPLSQSLKELMPARMWPVGRYAAYSNFGISLVGLVVENVSGTPFDQYIEDNIFSVLSMSKSSFREPLPVPLLATPPLGYIFEDQKFIVQNFEYVHNLAPAGAMTSSASDMARFMVAHLQEGQFGTTRILGQDAARQMQTQDFTHHEDLNGMAFGFHVGQNNGVETIYHDGDTNHFHTMMTLQKASNVGLFIAVNSEEGDGLVSDLTKAFYNEFYASSPKADLAPTSKPYDAEEYAGAYRMNRHNYHGFEKLLGLIFEVQVENSSEAGLRIMGDNPAKLIKGKGDLFYVEGKDKKTAFGRGDDGRVNYLFLGDRPNSAFYKLAWYETRNSHLLIWLSAIIASLTMVFRLRRPMVLGKSDDKFNFFASLTSLFILVFFGVLVYMLIIQQDLLYDFIPVTFYIAMTFGLLIVPAALGSVIYLGLTWQKTTHWGKRTYRVILCIIFVAQILSMNYWCLLGYHP